MKNKQFKFINSYYFVNFIFLSEIIYDVFLKRTSDNIQYVCRIKYTFKRQTHINFSISIGSINV